MSRIASSVASSCACSRNGSAHAPDLARAHPRRQPARRACRDRSASRAAGSCRRRWWRSWEARARFEAFSRGMVHMKAAVFAKQGLELREVSQPQPKAGDVLVRVRYAGLNRRDLTRAPGDEGTFPGMDLAGERAIPASRSCAWGRAVMPSRRSRGLRLLPAPPGMPPGAGGGAAARAPHHARCAGRRGQAAAWRKRAHPGRLLRRRADGLADREAHGRAAGHRFLATPGASQPLE